MTSNATSGRDLVLTFTRHRACSVAELTLADEAGMGGFEYQQRAVARQATLQGQAGVRAEGAQPTAAKYGRAS